MEQLAKWNIKTDFFIDVLNTAGIFRVKNNMDIYTLVLTEGKE